MTCSPVSLFFLDYPFGYPMVALISSRVYFFSLLMVCNLPFHSFSGPVFPEYIYWYAAKCRMAVNICKKMSSKNVVTLLPFRLRCRYATGGTVPPDRRPPLTAYTTISHKPSQHIFRDIGQIPIRRSVQQNLGDIIRQKNWK